MRYRPTVTLRILCGAYLLVLSSSLVAQLGVGDNTKMTLNGYLGMGYSGDFGETGTSGHGLFGSGSGQLSGYYYHPSFLSFDVRPFYNRNQDNTSFASVLSETGIDATANLFGGSHFPGSVSYSKASANGSLYGVPGATGLTSDSSTQTFSVSWSELLPSMPTVTATFGMNSSSATLQGEPGTTDSSSRTFNLMSHYKVDGWGLAAFLNHQNFSVKLPTFLSPTNSESDSSGTSYGVSANHRLPLTGMFEAGYHRTDYSSETGNYHNRGSTDTADSTVSFRPFERFTIQGQVRYTGNLIGALQQSVAPGAPPFPTSDQTSHELSLGTYGTYELGHGFILIGYASRQVATFEGIDTTITRAGGTLTYSYSRPLFGILYFSFGMVNNATNSGGGSLGFVGSVALKRQMGGWQLDSDFSYAQNVQTIVAYYTSSNYSYGAMVRRRFGTRSYWTASYRGLQTGLTQFPGYGNRSDTLMTTLGRGWYGFSGSYSKSHGTAILSTTGTLNPTPLAPVVAPDQALYDGRAYGVGFNVIPLKRMVINVNWYRTRSDTLTTQAFSNNNSERYYGQMQYNLRKLSFRAGYWRVNQSIGANSRLPTIDNTYYFNISRWFDIF